MGRFDGAVAVVTGGALGIGGATARRLASDGARVLIADIETKAAAANVARIEEAGGTAAAIEVDVTLAVDAKRMVAGAVERWGRLDILVQNAFSPSAAPESMSGDAVEVPEEGWEAGMALLAKALYLGAKFAVPEMRRQGGGSIVNVGSVHARLAAAGWLVYEAGKAAAVAITRQLACEYGPDGIRVNAVSPAHIVTERGAEWWKRFPGGLEVFADQYPLRRTGRPDEVAAAIAFLCSDDASFITGHDLLLDGGLTIQLQENVAVRQIRYASAHPEAQLPE